MPMRELALYTSDNAGTQYRVLKPTWQVAFAANPFGWAADDPSKPFLPRYVKQRYILLKDPTSGRHRKVACGNTTASGWTTLSTSFTLPNSDGTSTSYTSDGRVGEKTRGV